MIVFGLVRTWIWTWMQFLSFAVLIAWNLEQNGIELANWIRFYFYCRCRFERVHNVRQVLALNVYYSCHYTSTWLTVFCEVFCNVDSIANEAHRLFSSRILLWVIFEKIIILRSETVYFQYLAALLISCYGVKLKKNYRRLL